MAAADSSSTSDHARGMGLAASSALLAAVFLISYKAAQAYAPRSTVVVAMLIGAAVFNSGTALVATRGRLKLDRVALLALFGVTLLNLAARCRCDAWLAPNRQARPGTPPRNERARGGCEAGAVDVEADLGEES